MIKWMWGKPLVNSYSNEPQKGFVETTPDAGVPFRRVRFTDIMDLVQASFILTKSEYADFMSWYKSDIKQGAIPFLFYDCRYDRERVARIIDKPSYQPNSKFMNVTVQIAFESEVIDEEKRLVVNSDHLVVNAMDYLTVNRRMHL